MDEVFSPSCRSMFCRSTNGKFFPLRIEKYKANSFETVSCTKLPDSSVQSDNQVNSSDTNTSLSLQEESSYSLDNLH